jgi:hypothetical protein
MAHADLATRGRILRRMVSDQALLDALREQRLLAILRGSQRSRRRRTHSDRLWDRLPRSVADQPRRPRRDRCPRDEDRPVRPHRCGHRHHRRRPAPGSRRRCALRRDAGSVPGGRRGSRCWTSRVGRCLYADRDHRSGVPRHSRQAVPRFLRRTGVPGRASRAAAHCSATRPTVAISGSFANALRRSAQPKRITDNEWILARCSEQLTTASKPSSSPTKQDSSHPAAEPFAGAAQGSGLKVPRPWFNRPYVASARSVILEAGRCPPGHERPGRRP